MNRLVVLISCLLVLAASHSIAHAPGGHTHSKGDFKSCPDTGDGGDPGLNALKNRDISPNKFSKLTVVEVTDDLPQDLPAGRRTRRAK